MLTTKIKLWLAAAGITITAVLATAFIYQAARISGLEEARTQALDTLKEVRNDLDEAKSERARLQLQVDDVMKSTADLQLAVTKSQSRAATVARRTTAHIEQKSNELKLERRPPADPSGALEWQRAKLKIIREEWNQ